VRDIKRASTTGRVGRWLCRQNWHLPENVVYEPAQPLVDLVAPGRISRIKVCRYCRYPRFWCEKYPGSFRIDDTARKYTGRLIAPTPEQVMAALRQPRCEEGAR
jgi:hypothetical protein